MDEKDYEIEMKKSNVTDSSNKFKMENIILLKESNQTNGLSNADMIEFTNYMYVSGNKDYSKFKEWRDRKISAVTIVNPELPMIDNRPTK